MRKINILKSIVDFIWIITVPIGIPLILLFISAILFYDFADLNIKIQGIELIVQNLFSKILMAILLLNYLLIIYGLYLFRRSLRYFLNAKIFDVFVINSFRKIGNVLIISGIISFITSIVAAIYFKQKFTLELGLNSNLILIGLGLFFLILSEIFTIAKSAKQENDLTI